MRHEVASAKLAEAKQKMATILYKRVIVFGTIRLSIQMYSATFFSRISNSKISGRNNEFMPLDSTIFLVKPFLSGAENKQTPPWKERLSPHNFETGPVFPPLLRQESEHACFIDG